MATCCRNARGNDNKEEAAKLANLGSYFRVIVVETGLNSWVGVGFKITHIFKEMDDVNMSVSLVKRKRLKIQKKKEIVAVTRSYHQF